MTTYDNNNKGAIWKNDRKQSDKHPDYNGAITVDGKEYWLSAWRGDKSNPKSPALKLSVTLKDVAKIKPQAPAPISVDDYETDVPF